MATDMSHGAGAAKDRVAGNVVGSDTTNRKRAIMTVSKRKSANVDRSPCGGFRQRRLRSACNIKTTDSGFTLIEVLIVVAIIGILAAIAVPSYARYITSANRTDAMNFLTEVAGEQQRYFSENNQYAEKMSELGYGAADTFQSPEAHYTISVANPNGVANGYVLSATPVAGGRQASDDECDVFTISSTGAKANTGGSSSNCW